MIGACVIIAQGLRGPIAQEYRAGVIHHTDIFQRLSHAQFQVLRRQFVRKIQRLAQIVAHNDFTVVVKGFLNDLLTHQGLDLPVNLPQRVLSQRLGSG